MIDVHPSLPAMSGMEVSSMATPVCVRPGGFGAWARLQESLLHLAAQLHVSATTCLGEGR